MATKIADCLAAFGYDPYVAIFEKSLRGLKENLFQRLLETEYFLFVDTPREKIAPDEHRGSLSCHQELAIAAFLNKPVLAFQQKGIRKLDGVMGLLQANATEFETDEELMRVLRAEVTAKWKIDWRDELALEVSPEPFEENHNGQPVTYWFVAVKNENIYRTAHDCYGYLRRACRLSGPVERIPLETVEYKWTGYTFPNVIIPPKALRRMDAFMMYHREPIRTLSSAYSDSYHHRHMFGPAGEYLLEFAVHSRNFRESKAVFFLSFDGTSIDSVTFRRATAAEIARLPSD